MVEIECVKIRELTTYVDKRGELSEMFRSDELPSGHFVEMGYCSVTNPGMARGPHEHAKQIDYFIFMGASEFELYLWDNRSGAENSDLCLVKMEQGYRYAALIPPGIIHGYKNIGNQPGLVLNFPNKLYKGVGKTEEVDEIRHENVEDSPYRIN